MAELGSFIDGWLSELGMMKYVFLVIIPVAWTAGVRGWGRGVIDKLMEMRFMYMYGSVMIRIKRMEEEERLKYWRKK